MNWLLGTLLIATSIYLLQHFRKIKKIKTRKKQLMDNWGKPKEDEYYNFFNIERYFKNDQHKDAAFHIISEKTKIDLDLDEVFKYVDRTSSKIGQQYLYYKLRTIHTERELEKLDSFVAIFEKEENLRIESQYALSSLNSDDAYYLEELIHGKQIDRPKYLWLVKLLSIFAILILISGFFYPLLFILILPIYAVNMVFHFRNKNNIGYYRSGISQLSKGYNIVKIIAKNKEIKEEQKDFSFLSTIKKLKLKAQFIGFEKMMDSDLAFILWFLLEQFNILFNLEYIVFHSFIGTIKKEIESINQMYIFLGKMDVAISILSIKKGNDSICKPKFTEKEQVNIQNVIHPLIPNCIANDLSLDKKSLLLTGSNMSGKTTFIRSVAINSILAQTLNIAFAEKYEAPFFKLYSSIRIADDVLESTSYYLEEVLTIKELIDTSKIDTPCLFILDEIFKGTNTIERISGGKAILSYLNKNNNFVLVSTHDIELTELLSTDNYQLYHFSESIENNQLSFDYKLKAGKLKTRNAIKILELYDYPSEIVANAIKTEKDFFNTTN